MSRRPARLAGAIDAATNTIGLASAVQEFLAFHRQKGSSERYLGKLAGFLGDRHKRAGWQALLVWAAARGLTQLGQLDKAASSEWLEAVKAGSTETQHAHACACLRRLLRFCVAEGYLAAMPLRIADPKLEEKEIQVFTHEEVQAIAAVVRGENPRDLAIFMLFCDTGIRCSEMAGILTGDIRWDREEILIRGKGNKQRTVQFSAAYSAMTKYRRIRPETDKTDAFFLSFAPGRAPVWSGGKHRVGRQALDRYAFAPAALTRNGLWKLVEKWGKLANILNARCSPHTFRHYYAVQFLRNGGDVLQLMRILGHSKIETTMIYAKLADTDIKKAARSFSPAASLVPPRHRVLDVA